MTRAVILLALLPAVAAAAPTERRLYADTATASSFLWNDWNRFQENYLPLYVSDDDPRTAWTEGAANAGEGEWIRLATTPMDGATRLRLKIRNGYQKSASLFEKNARVKQATIKLLPGGATQKVTLTDTQGWQEVALEQPAGKLEGFELHVDSVYPGSKYSDLCISDIQVYVTAETKENPAFEKGKLGKVLAWKADRLKAAKLFKEGAKEVPLYPSYSYKTQDAADAPDLWEKCHDDRACWIKETLAGAKQLEKEHAEAFALARAAVAGDKTVPGRLAPMDTRSVPAVDGVYVPSLEGEGYGLGMELPLVDNLSGLQAAKLGAIMLEGGDVKASVADVLASKAPGCKSKEGRLYTWLLRDKESSGRERLRALLEVKCGRIEARDGYEYVATMQVAVYDADGQLELTAGHGYVNAFMWTKGDHPMLQSGRGLSMGSVAELTVPEVAKAP
jgi:hypothetical protein